jgi:hypothetical protein
MGLVDLLGNQSMWYSVTLLDHQQQAIMEWVRLHSESITGRQGYAAGYKETC